jgi:protein TonB
MKMLSRYQVRELARWSICGVLVFGVHGVVTAGLATWSEPISAGSPEGIILLDLNPNGGGPIGQGGKIEPKDADPDPQPEPDRADKDEKREPEPPQQALDQPPPEPQMEPPPPLKNVVVTLPSPVPAPPPKPRPKKLAAVNPPGANITEGQASAGNRGDLKAAYSKAIVAHINSYKIYPSDAQLRHEEGTVELRFTLNRHGQVLSSNIVRSSGHAELDREALDMLRRAQPFPTPPAELPGQQFPYTAPMRYYLR